MHVKGIGKINVTLANNKFIGLTAQQGGVVNCENPAAYVLFNKNEVVNCSADLGGGMYKVGQCNLISILGIYHSR